MISERCRKRLLRSSRLAARAQGVLLVIPQRVPIREAVAALILIWADDTAEEYGYEISF
jgi:hypothetical protein